MSKKYLFPPLPEMKVVIWPPDFTEEEKKYFLYVQKSRMEDAQRLCLGYQCECGAQTSFVIDREPMSKKIGFSCETCKKFDYRPICNPLVFYNEEFGWISLEELKEIEILDKEHYQIIYLKQFLD